MTTAAAASADTPAEQEGEHEQQPHGQAEEGSADGLNPQAKRARVEEEEGEAAAAAAAAAEAAAGAGAAGAGAAAAAAAAANTGGGVQVLRDTLLDAPAVTALRDKYPSAPGYPHCIVQDVLEPGFFRSLRDEMVGALSANFKETDLFKLFQTGDLANLDGSDPEMAARLPHLLALRNAIYSPPFRRFVAEITGCAPLTDRTDCSSNLYAQGCHLLCHDDVIGTRCISFIIYLTDPDEPWTAADGGALEIYPLSEPGQLGAPAVQPVTAHLPLPNSMAFFTVLPGQSFHAVEEVYAAGKMRLSISGWYHAATPPPGADKASLSQLQTREAEAGLPVVLLPVSSSPPSSSSSTSRDADDDKAAAARAFLSQWINPAYLGAGAVGQIRARFAEEGSILLHDFLLPAVADSVRAAALARDKADAVGGGRKPPGHGVGFGRGWEPVGPPHKQRYMRFTTRGGDGGGEGEGEGEGDAAALCSAGVLLAAVRDELFASPRFAAYLEALTCQPLATVRGECRRFRPGLDYTLAHYGLLCPEPRLDASLCCAVAGATKRQARKWASGDVGGFLCYINADLGQEGADAAESYQVRRKKKAVGQQQQQEAEGEEKEDVLSVFAASNALSLVLRRPDAMRFVKYVSASAPSSRWDVVAEYGLRGTEGEGEKEKEKGGE